MLNRKFFVLLIVTVIVIVTASLFTSVRAPQTEKKTELLFPGLKTDINAVSKIRLRDVNSTIELAKHGDSWVLASSDGYPADFDKVRALLLQFSEFEILAEKTRRPHLYYRLSVEDPVEKGSRAVVAHLYDQSDTEMAALIIGREKTMNAANPIPGFYGRLPGEEVSLLLSGKPDVSADSRDWFDTALLHVPSETVSEVRIRHPGQPEVLLERTSEGQPDLFLRNIPEGKKAQSLVIINRMAAVLEDVVAEQVRGVNTVQWPETAVAVTIKSFDGLTINLKLARLDDKPFANFQFETSDEGSQQEVAQLNARHANWVYQIQDFKFSDLTKKLDDLTRDKR